MEQITASSQNKIRLIKLLGEGSFGKTYLAEILDPILSQTCGCNNVAVKLAHSDVAESALKAELAHNSQLQNRHKPEELVNLVRYLDFTIYENRLAMIMEYLCQGNLRKRIGYPGDTRAIDVPQSIVIAIGVLRGLTVLHKEYIVHRDLKPENVLLDADIPKIGDLGVARTMVRNQLRHSIFGAIEYCAPEVIQYRGHSYGADVWSVGVILYEMLTGRLPFDSTTRNQDEVCNKIIGGEPDPIQQFASDVPLAISDIVLAALAKNKANRISASEMLVALIDSYDPERGFRMEAGKIRNALKEGRPLPDVSKLVDMLIRHYPTNPESYHIGITSWNMFVQHERSLALAEEGLAKCGPNGPLLFDKAICLENLGRLSDAEGALKQAIDTGLSGAEQSMAQTLIMKLQRSDLKLKRG